MVDVSDARDTPPTLACPVILVLPAALQYTVATKASFVSGFEDVIDTFVFDRTKSASVVHPEGLSLTVSKKLTALPTFTLAELGVKIAEDTLHGIGVGVFVGPGVGVFVLPGGGVGVFVLPGGGVGVFPLPQSAGHDAEVSPPPQYPSPQTSVQ